MSSPNERSYAGQTASQRVAQRTHALLDAALDAIAVDGWRQLRVEAVCRRAKVNKRFFYEIFDDLDELAAALVTRLAGEAIATAASVTQDAPLPEVAHDTLEAFVVYLTDDPRRAQVLFGEMIGSSAGAEQRSAALKTIAAMIASHARVTHAYAGEDGIAELTSSLLVGGTVRVILDWINGDIPMPREQLIDDLTALWLLTGNGAVAHAADR